MDTLEVLREIGCRADDSVLALLSRVPPLWSILKPELEKQHFNLNMKIGNENWHQIYNILIATREGNPFLVQSVLALNEYNLTSVELLLAWGYDPSVSRSFSLYEAAYQ